MKLKLSIIFFLVIFGVSAWLGFGLTSQISKAQTVNETPLPGVSQSNILMVGLDKDAQGEQILVSAWVALVRAGDQPSLIFKKIYPDLGNEEDLREIQSGFLKVKNNILPDSFEQKITALRLQITGQLVVDLNNLGVIAPYFGVSFPPGLAAGVRKGNDPTYEEVYLRSLCSFLTKSAPAAAGSTTARRSASTWMDPWKGLVTSLRFSSCTVVLVDP